MGVSRPEKSDIRSFPRNGDFLVDGAVVLGYWGRNKTKQTLE